MHRPRLIRVAREDPAAVRAGLLRALAANPPAISPKHLYDAVGSRLFAAITELPEYYPTRTEGEILARHAEDIAAALPPVEAMIDLGAGDCGKAQRLFRPLGVKRYVAVDISVEWLERALDLLGLRYPALELIGVGMDFSTRLALPAEAGGGPRLIFYPGSSIGNFTPEQALGFLRQVHGACQGGGLLIGVDLVKPAGILEPAYDDALGVTAAFNRNLLRHVNRLAGTDFELADWRHVAFYDGARSRIEMHLEAVRDVTVRWAHGQRRFARGERIHTESSYKWRAGDFALLLQSAGFSAIRHWSDERGWFAVFLARS
ncbi:MAG: L-histidine N(alpha)-methyltransferase [Rhodocyclaceae bacterium]